MNQLHQIQREIINKLIFSKGLRYTQLKPNKDLENNQFDFHLDRLIGLGYVQKQDNLYALTDSGKNYSATFDTDKVASIKQAKLTVWLAPVRQGESGWEFLIYTRLKHPFFGCQGFCGGKINYGDQIIQTANRELLEETGLTGDPELKQIVHYRVFDKLENLILEDKIMFLYRIVNPSGTLSPENPEGKYEWVKEEDIPKFVTNPFESLESLTAQIQLLKSEDGSPRLVELDHYNAKF